MKFKVKIMIGKNVMWIEVEAKNKADAGDIALHQLDGMANTHPSEIRVVNVTGGGE